MTEKTVETECACLLCNTQIRMSLCEAQSSIYRKNMDYCSKYQCSSSGRVCLACISNGYLNSGSDGFSSDPEHPEYRDFHSKDFITGYCAFHLEKGPAARREKKNHDGSEIDEDDQGLLPFHKTANSATKTGRKTMKREKINHIALAKEVKAKMETMSVEQVAKEYKKANNWPYVITGILNLSKPVQDMIDSQLNCSEAYKLHGLPEERQMELAQEIVDQGIKKVLPKIVALKKELGIRGDGARKKGIGKKYLRKNQPGPTSSFVVPAKLDRFDMLLESASLFLLSAKKKLNAPDSVEKNAAVGKDLEAVSALIGFARDVKKEEK